MVVENKRVQNNNTTHFHSLLEQKPSTTAKHALKCARFPRHSWTCKQVELDNFATPFNVVAAAAPSNF